MPDRHSKPASPSATVTATRSSHDSPACTSRTPSAPATPPVCTWTTTPGQPSSGSTRLLPPASTGSASPAAPTSRTASTSSTSESTGTSRLAGPPRRSVVSGASGAWVMTAPSGNCGLRLPYGQMPAQEVQLVGDGTLEALAQVDVEVAERVPAHLGPAGRAPRRLLDRGRRGDRVAVGNLEEDRAGQVGGAGDGPVAGGIEGGAGAELVAEGRAGNGEEAGLGVRRRHGRERARRADDRYPQRLATERPADGVAHPERGQPQERCGAGVAGDLDQRRQAVGGGHLRDHRGDATVVGRNRDHVTAGVRAAPQDDAVGVDAGQAAREPDHG